MDQVLAEALIDEARPVAKTALRSITPLVRKPGRRIRKGPKAPVAAVPPPGKAVKQPPATPPSGGV